MNFFVSLSLCLSMSAAVQVAQVEQPQIHDYATAFRLAQSGDKPLLVLVTSEWCAPCQVLKKTTIPSMLASDGFSGFHFAMVDVDQEPNTAAKLTENRPVPQFIIFEKNGANWKKRYSIGYLGATDLQAFLAPSQPQPVRVATSNAAHR